MARKKTFSVLILVFLLSACELRQQPSLDQKQINAFRSDPGAVADYERQYGDITNYALPPFIAAAAKYTGTTYADVEALIAKAPQAHTTPGQVSVGPGAHHIVAMEPGGQQGRALGPVTFENNSNQPTALILEVTTVTGQFSGFSYVQLEPSDRFVYDHNTPAAGVVVVVVGGGVVIVWEGVTRLYESAFTCHLVTKTFYPDYCSGSCAAGTSCSVNGTRPYGWGGLQATACVCR